MKIFTHDGSLEGFVTAVQTGYAEGGTDIEIPATGEVGPNLFATPIHITSQPEKARTFLAEWPKRYGPEVPRRLMYLYYSESTQAGTLALAYLRLLDEFGLSIDQHKTHPTIRVLQQLCQKVGQEIHRFKGLLRFTEGEPPTLRAVMEPDFNILMPTAMYFRRRLGGQPWIIVDARRQRAAAWNTQIMRFFKVDRPLFSDRSADEFAHLWKTFYRSVAIPNRKNEALRRQNMPERYWKHLSEL